MFSLKENLVNLPQFVTKQVSNISNFIMARSSHNIIDPTSFSSVLRNPQLPLCFQVPNKKLDLGTLISIYATFHQNGRRFRMDFYDFKCEHINGNETQPSGDVSREQIAFHFNPRIGDMGRDVVVMNSFADGNWTREERVFDNFPFKQGAPFQMMILVEEDGFKIAVDGEHRYEFKHRSPYRDIGRIHIEGDISVDLIEFRKELQYLLQTEETPALLQAMKDTSTKDRQSRSVESPKVPYIELDPNLSSKSWDIYIAGMLPIHVNENFVINLVNKDPQHPPGINKNIPVHISIRPDINAIVRNTMTDGIWGEEELYLEGPSRLIPGSHFDLMISKNMDKIAVATQGQPAFDYKHRHDPKTINALEILGSVVLTSVRFEFKDV